MSDPKETYVMPTFRPLTEAGQVQVKVRIFADKPKKRWLGAFAFAKAKFLKSTPLSYEITQTVDDEAEFVKGDKVYCVTDEKKTLIAAWKV